MSQPPPASGRPEPARASRASPWRAEVLGLKQRCPRGPGSPRLYAGTPGGRSVWVDLTDLTDLDDRSTFDDPGAIAAPPAPARRQGDPTRGLDLALRTDIVLALLDRLGRLDGVSRLDGHEHPDRGPRSSRPALVWLARPGPHAETCSDRAWLAAARCASGQPGCPITFAVVTRHGWFDPATGRGERWRRARDRRG